MGSASIVYKERNLKNEVPKIRRGKYHPGGNTDSDRTRSKYTKEVPGQPGNEEIKKLHSDAHGRGTTQKGKERGGKQFRREGKSARTARPKKKSERTNVLLLSEANLRKCHLGQAGGKRRGDTRIRETGPVANMYGKGRASSGGNHLPVRQPERAETFGGLARLGSPAQVDKTGGPIQPRPVLTARGGNGEEPRRRERPKREANNQNVLKGVFEKRPHGQ